MKKQFSLENSKLTCPSFIDMGLILSSLKDIEAAYENCQKGGFKKAVLLYTGEEKNEFISTLDHRYLTEKYQGLIPAFVPIKDKKFQNMHVLFSKERKKIPPIFYHHTIKHSLYIIMAYQLMLKAKDYGALYISFPYNKDISAGGVLHEGLASFKMGLPGISYLSEEAVVSRDLELARSIGAKLHIHQITCKRSVELIREAKKAGINVTAGTSPGHLLFTHNDCLDFNQLYKYLPPLREEEDRQTLISAVNDGTIDVISSGHFNSFKKNDIFLYSDPCSLPHDQIFKGLYNNLVKKDLVSLEKIVDALAINPRKILQIKDLDETIQIDLPE